MNAGIPDRPELVTVIPFSSRSDDGDVVIPVDVDGYQGLWLLDTGNPGFILNAAVLQPTAQGGVDTIRSPGLARGDQTASQVYIDHVRLGTLSLTHVTAPPYPGLPAPLRPVNALLAHFGFDPGYMLGNIGLAVLEPFETIIDYPRRRVVLIRLDAAGRRLVQVPAYTPVWAAPLIDMGERSNPIQPEPWHWWGVQAQLGGVISSWLIDTETSKMSFITEAAYPDQARRLPRGQVVPLPEPLVIAGRRFTLDSVKNYTGPDGANSNLLGAPFLHHLGVVGFNHRAHQFILYR